MVDGAQLARDVGGGVDLRDALLLSGQDGMTGNRTADR
jgi:hypothetical protein